MDINSAAEHIQEIFRSACLDLFEHLDCSVQASTDDDLSGAQIAVIDAGSKEIDVNIAIEIPLSVLSLTYPCTEIVQVGDEALEDWASELSSRLMGRFKAKLYSHNIILDLGLPNAYFDSSLNDVFPPCQFMHSEYLSIDGQICAFHLGQAFFEQDVPFEVEVADDLDITNESELELF